MARISSSSKRAKRAKPGDVAADYRVMLVCSSGGHLSQLLTLEPWWRDHDRVWVSFDKPDVSSRLAGERVIWGHYPTTRNIPNLIRNSVLALSALRRERPAVVISDGAGLAVPFFWFAKALRIKTVYLEVYDRIDSPTMTGRLVQPVCDLMLVQWPEQLPLYKRAQLAGTVW